MAPISPKPLFLSYLGLPWAVLAPTSWLEMQTDTSEWIMASVGPAINDITRKCNVIVTIFPEIENI